jgi:hypothetical protein
MTKIQNFNQNQFDYSSINIWDYLRVGIWNLGFEITV